MTTHDTLVSVEEAAKLLKISRSLTHNLISRGDLPSLKIGKRRLIPVDGMRAMIERLRAESGKAA